MAMLDRDHSDFIGVDALIQQNADQLALFRAFAENRDWQSFHSNHYDWWAFPIGSPSSYGYRYAVSKESVEVLKQSPQFLSNLAECADLLLLSWGWDVSKNKNLTNVDSGQAWAHWPIRLYKAWRSMQIFGLTELEISLSAYAHYLRENGYSFKYQGRDLFESISHETVMANHQRDSTIEDFKEFFESENLDVPIFVAHLENCLTYYPGGHWATQPTPALVERYSVTDLLEYLKGSVRDQYSFSYERYGGVYELNFRHVSGELAMIVHFFSGGFRDSEIGTAEWNGMVMCINSLLAMTASVSGEERMRKYLLVVSKFPHEFQFLERNGNNWEIVEQIDTWEAAYDYLKSVGQDK